MLSALEPLDNAGMNWALLSFLTTDWSSLQSGQYVSKHDVNKVTGLTVYTTIPQSMMMQKCAHMCEKDHKREIEMGYSPSAISDSSSSSPFSGVERYEWLPLWSLQLYCC